MPQARKTDFMKPGDVFPVLGGGLYGGKEAKVIDPTPFPDDDEHRRRKITVEIEGHTVFLLPRLLDDGGRFKEAQRKQLAAQQNVTQLPVVNTNSAPAIEGAETGDHHEGQRFVIPENITSVDDPRLDPWRPDPSIVKEYLSRKVPSGQTDVEYLLSFWENRENILLVGDTQAGKTMVVQVLAVLAGKAMGLDKPLPLFTLSGSSGVTDFDLFGQPTAYVDPDSGVERLVWLPGVVDLAVRAGGILYLDECNMMGERVTASLHPVTDDRRCFVNRAKAVVVKDENGGETFLPDIVEGNPDLWIVGTINPGYRGAGAMNEAFTNRFRWIPWTYDDAVEKRLVPSAAVRLLGEALRDARANRSITTPIGTSALRNVCQDVERFGVETALWMLQAMFQPQERPKVEAIITDRSISILLQEEEDAKRKAEAAKKKAEAKAKGEPVPDDEDDVEFTFDADGNVVIPDDKDTF